MASETLAAIRKLTDSSGLLWEKSLAAGQPSTLLGYPVYEDSNVAAIASNSHSICFGDLNSGYTIADRQGIFLLRDPYTSKGFTSFYITKRVAGGVVDFDAVKYMKFAAS